VFTVYEDMVKVWDASTGACTKTLKLDHNFKKSGEVRVAKSGSAILDSFDYDCSVKLWDASTGECSIFDNGESIRHAFFSHNETSVLTVSNGYHYGGECDDRLGVSVWDASTGKCKLYLGVHGKKVMGKWCNLDICWRDGRHCYPNSIALYEPF